MTRGMWIVLLLSLCSCVIVGSANHFQRSGLSRAAFDMSCPEHQLQIHELGGGAIGVTGCDRKTTYVYAKGAGWVANMATEGSGH